MRSAYGWTARWPSTGTQLVKAALDGFGLAYVHEDAFREPLKDGRHVQILGGWTPPFPGYHLYYPSRRHPAPAFTCWWRLRHQAWRRTPGQYPGAAASRLSKPAVNRAGASEGVAPLQPRDLR
ncbi:LysR substrate-binding domain-containing protein [Sinorhizobium meliloti]|uniref:LysR substrate-binding domain-containing protein n=1 Tax=Rhizobium meliloti TaxID=382 RepID=UPI001F244693|nr:LysR substrate-binding domain-containing protein [Sinorhizobium meliloti]